MFVWAVLSLLPIAPAAAQGPAPLAVAAKSRDFQALRGLIRSGADVNTPQSDGTTALHWAVHWDDLAAAQLLIKARANVDAITDYGVRPLWLASQNGNPAMIRLLLEHGAAAGSSLPSGETTLMAAARTGNADAVRALLKAHAPVNARESERGQTALMWALAEGHISIATLLLDAGADLRARSNSGNTPLMFAARQGDLRAVELLVSRGSAVDEVATDGTTALIVAIQRGHVSVVCHLLDRGANPNIDAAGYTALHWAVAKWETVQSYDYDRIETGEWRRLAGLGAERLGVVKLLLSHGADPNKRTKAAPPRFGYTAFERHYAVGATPFYLASMSADVDVMRLLVAQGADPHAATLDGTTSLMVASGLAEAPFESRISESDRLEAIKFALVVGQDVNVKNAAGDTALHGAAKGGHVHLVRFLVQKGADRDARNGGGMTALALAEDGFMFGGQLHVRPAVAAALHQLRATK